jgi:molecular chaperone HtpG
MILEQLVSYMDYPLVNIADADLALPKGEKEPVGVAVSIPYENFASLVARVQTMLCDRVLDVRLTDQLNDTPARLVDIQADADQDTGRIHRLGMDKSGVPRKMLELNPRHPILAQLNSLSLENPLSSLIIEQIYENARLAASIQPQDR